MEEAHVPLDRRGGPCALDAARDRVIAHAAFMPALPAEPLLRDVRAFRFGTDL